MNKSISASRSYLEKRALKLLGGALVVLFTITVLSAWLFPFSYMLVTSVKSPSQITRGTILPLTQLEYTYKGMEQPGYRVKSDSPILDIYLVPTEDGEQTWALLKAGEAGSPHIFVDFYQQTIQEWEGDITTLERAPQVVWHTYKGDYKDPAIGLTANAKFPLYNITTEDGTTQQWAMVQGPHHVFLDINNPEAGAFLWDGDLSTLQRAPQIKTFSTLSPSKDDVAAGIEGRVVYPIYQSLEGNDNEVWALIRDGFGVDPTTFAVFDAANTERPLRFVEWNEEIVDLTPVWEDTLDGDPVYHTSEGRFWVLVDSDDAQQTYEFKDATQPRSAAFTWQGDLSTLERGYAPGEYKYNGPEEASTWLRSPYNYPVYYVETEAGQQVWALIREGTHTDESFFINTELDETQQTLIRQTVDTLTLQPVVQDGVYDHNSEPIPPWSLQEGDKFPLYESPYDDETQWALVAGYTISSGRPSVFIDPARPEEGVFTWDDRWYGTLDTVDEIDPRWQNFEDAWHDINFPRLLFNTSFIAITGLIGTLVSCSLVAYGFARFPIPYKNTIFMILIATIVLPRQVTLVPTYAFFSQIGWTNTWLPLIVPHFFANAYNVFLLRQFFQTIPREMDEAAMIDGAGPFRILRSIIIPQAWPALVAAGLFHFVFAWNDYFEPLIYTLGNEEAQPISVGIQQYNFQYTDRREMIQATSLMAMALPIFLFFVAQRYFMRGIVITGVEK